MKAYIKLNVISEGRVALPLSLLSDAVLHRCIATLFFSFLQPLHNLKIDDDTLSNLDAAPVTHIDSVDAKMRLCSGSAAKTC